MWTESTGREAHRFWRIHCNHFFHSFYSFILCRIDSIIIVSFRWSGHWWWWHQKHYLSFLSPTPSLVFIFSSFSMLIFPFWHISIVATNCTQLHLNRHNIATIIIPYLWNRNAWDNWYGWWQLINESTNTWNIYWIEWNHSLSGCASDIAATDSNIIVSHLFGEC